jgi:hypothetical protein
MSPDRPPRNHALWLGPVIAFVGVVSYFQFFARFPALRDFPWVNLPLVLVGIALSLGGLWGAHVRGSRWPVKAAAGLGLASSLLFGGFLIAYVFGISNSLPAATATTRALVQAPDFELEDAAGRVLRVSDYRGSKVVLVFYRGHW